MSNVVAADPDLLEAVALLLEQDFPELANAGTRHVGTDYPPNMKQHLPYVTLDDLGGPRDRFGGSTALDVEVFADDYDEAISLSRRIVAYLLGYPRSVEVDGRRVTLDRVEAQGPRELPWDDSSTRRFLSTTQISFRR